MAGRISLQGKKHTGSHTSYTDTAAGLVRVLEKDPIVRKISAGIIKTNLPNQQGRNRVKIIDEGACLLLSIRGNISMQEVRFYVTDKELFIDLVKQYALDKKMLCQT